MTPDLEIGILGSFLRSFCDFADLFTWVFFRDSAIVPTLARYEHPHNGYYVMGLSI